MRGASAARGVSTSRAGRVVSIGASNLGAGLGSALDSDLGSALASATAAAFLESRRGPTGRNLRSDLSLDLSEDLSPEDLAMNSILPVAAIAVTLRTQNEKSDGKEEGDPRGLRYRDRAAATA